MEWLTPFITVLGVFISNGALILPLFLWNRAESRADIRHLDAKLESNRELVRAIHDESKAMISAIDKEIKDFHYRLLEIEKRNKNS
jgi:hypothetical protein